VEDEIIVIEITAVEMEDEILVIPEIEELRQEVVASIVARTVIGQEIVLMKMEEIAASTVEDLDTLHVNAKKREERAETAEIALILTADQEVVDQGQEVLAHVVPLVLVLVPLAEEVLLLPRVLVEYPLQIMESQDHHKQVG